MITDVKRGDVFYANLNPVIGFEQGGVRPVLIIQNNTGNLHAPTVLIAPITSNITKKTNLPTHCKITGDFFNQESIVLMEQIRTIDKTRLGKYLGHINRKQMNSFGKSIKISVGLSNQHKGEKKNGKRKRRKYS